MTALAAALLALAIASAALTIVSDERGRRRGVYVFKPLATSLLVALSLLGEGADGRYRALVAAGLALSLAGDVFLMLPRDRFVAGLASFLAAHLFYAAAFSAGISDLHLPPALFLSIHAALLLRVLWPRLGPLKAPVAVYAAALAAMAWLAVERALAGAPGAAPAAVGAILFVASDSALAVDRFARPLRHAPALVLGTYYAAQLLIALSTHV